MQTTVSVIIPTMKGREENLKRLISTIPDWCEIVVVDDDDILLAGKRNRGAIKSKGEYLLFIDDDNYLSAGAVEAALELAQQTRVGVVGFMACYDDQKELIADGGSIRNYQSGFTKGINTNERYGKTATLANYPVDEVANAFMIHEDLFFELGGFDEENFPIDLDEADFCKRAKDKNLKIYMCPLALVYHKSQTYSHIPDFRRPLNAYFMGRNRIIYQRKHNSRLRYCVYLSVFMPVFVCFYTLSLLWRKKPLMIIHFLKGVFDGIFCRRKNKYQPR